MGQIVVIIKPASETPLTMLALMPLLEEAGVPPGLVNVLPSKRTGALVDHMMHDPRVTGPRSLEIDGAAWSFDQAAIAVGSSPVRLPGWPQDDRIWDSTAALELRQVPGRLAIVGGGIIGLEMATVHAALGVQVTVVELMDQIAPGADIDAVRILRAALEAEGIVIHTGTKVASVKAAGKELTIGCDGAFAGQVTADAVIQAVGRSANGGKIAAGTAGVEVTDRGIVPVDASCRTTNPAVFAIGDVTGNPMLAHRATHQGHVAAEVASGHAAALDTGLIPSVAYTSPELVWVGLTATQARERGIAHKVASFPWAASGRNLCSGGGDGLTRLVYCPESHRILGATLVGRNAGELLAECVLAMEMGARLEDVALTVHAHPTLSETIAFTAERALGTLTDLQRARHCSATVPAEKARACAQVLSDGRGLRRAGHRLQRRGDPILMAKVWPDGRVRNPDTSRRRHAIKPLAAAARRDFREDQR